ncbi:hypothetical protein LTT66_31110 [Nocardia gipuzkoensis]|uniref:hypothetical protein n=1 Tax=Nocardia gipuzkoensis TaxID=2749991 RepID=UPI001E4499DA|nr:hypothetical protein [Nocardia gipuzkoensis]UGT67611.1 hypothetical protein LTT66_31110 [Nocardia gipuzkoensis]
MPLVAEQRTRARRRPTAGTRGRRAEGGYEGADHVALRTLGEEYLGSLRQLAPLLTAAD